jgi:ABC-type microcin C transport system permease subunit YejE
MVINSTNVNKTKESLNSDGHQFPESISTIVTRNPYMLSMKVERVDAKLGFYQKEFKLTGNSLGESQ